MNHLDNSEVRSYSLPLLSSLIAGAKAVGSGVIKAGSTALSSLGNAGSAIYKGADASSVCIRKFLGIDFVGSQRIANVA